MSELTASEEVHRIATEVRDPQPRIYYLRDQQKRPVACIASLRDATTDRVSFAVSTHNPLDPYSRKLGRAIALGRLATKPTTLATNAHILSAIIRYLAHAPVERFGGRVWTEVPWRTRKAALRWLNHRAWLARQDEICACGHARYLHFERCLNFACSCIHFKQPSSPLSAVSSPTDDCTCGGGQ